MQSSNSLFNSISIPEFPGMASTEGSLPLSVVSMATFLPVVEVVPIVPPLFSTVLFTALFSTASGGADRPLNGQSRRK